MSSHSHHQRRQKQESARAGNESDIRYGGFYFVCDHGKHGSAKRYNFVCNLFVLPSLFGQVRGVKQKLHPKSYRLATDNLTMIFHYTAEEEPPIPGSAKNKHTPFRRALALQSRGRNCNPAPDLVLRKLIFQGLLFFPEKCFFTDTGINIKCIDRQMLPNSNQQTARIGSQRTSNCTRQSDTNIRQQTASQIQGSGLRGERVLLTEILLPRIARQGIYGLISIGG